MVSGFNTRYSIVEPAQWVAMRQQLLYMVDESQDSLRFYFLGANWRGRVEYVGAKVTIDQEGPLSL